MGGIKVINIEQFDNKGGSIWVHKAVKRLSKITVWEPGGQ